MTMVLMMMIMMMMMTKIPVNDYLATDEFLYIANYGIHNNYILQGLPLILNKPRFFFCKVRKTLKC